MKMVLKIGETLAKAALGLSLTALSLGASNIIAAENEANDSYQNYHEGVSLLNLLNGLNLTEEQTRRILSINKEFKSERPNASPEDNAEAKAKAKKEMGKLYRYLLENPESEDKAILNNAVQAKRNIEKSSPKETAKLMSRMINGIENVLTPAQIEVVSNFKPCVAPPKDMRDPVRAGQAAVSSGAEKALEIARKASKEKMDELCQKASDKLIEHAMKKHELTDAEMNDIRKNVSNVLHTAATLSDTDFAIKKDELAEKLSPKEKNADAPGEKERNGKMKIAKFLLNPDIVIPVLEKRLEKAAPGGLKNGNTTGVSQSLPREKMT